MEGKKVITLIKTCITVVVYLDYMYEQVIYTVGRGPQYQNTIVADTAPLIVMVCAPTSAIFITNRYVLFNISLIFSHCLLNLHMREFLGLYMNFTLFLNF